MSGVDNRMPKNIVVLGGGIVGCATAHYLRKLAGEGDEAIRLTIVDPVGIAAAASGRAGGFLARDWHRGPGARLAKQSFALHAELASEFGSETIGYRACSAVQPTCMGGNTQKVGSTWYDGCVGVTPEIASREAAAQVIPARLSEALFAASGAHLIVGTPSKLSGAADGGFSLTVKGSGGTQGGSQEVACDMLLLACGAWTSQVARGLGIPMRATVSGLKAYSILLESTRPVDARCLFIDWRGDPFAGELELYPRIDGVYVCGCGEDPIMVGEAPVDVSISERAISCLKASAASVSSALNGAAVLRETACYLPCADTGAIVAGRLQHGVYVATGHTCWGILNGPATGQAMAELMLHGPNEDAAQQLLAPFSPR